MLGLVVVHTMHAGMSRPLGIPQNELPVSLCNPEEPDKNICQKSFGVSERKEVN
jgi:hypothetical protein